MADRILTRAESKAILKDIFRAEGWQGYFVAFLRFIALLAPLGRRIIDPDNPYLVRIYLIPRWLRRRIGRDAFLHYFVRSDEDREAHNHPWDEATSFVLTRGYLEERHHWGAETHSGQHAVITLRRKPWRPWGGARKNVFKIHRDTYHRVLLTDGRVWTLFSPRHRVVDESWGFKGRSGIYEPWQDFAARKARAKGED